MAKTKTKTVVPIKPPPVAPEPDSPIAALMEMQSLRRHCIRCQSRSDRSIEALVARSFGYHVGLAEPERKKMFKAAQKLRLVIEANAKARRPSDDVGLPPQIVNMVETNFVSRAQWDRMRANIEERMAATARELEIWPWVKEVKGVAELGLAVIVGEAGDIPNFTRPGKVWKRLGMACIDGMRQGRVPPDLSRDDRAEAWKMRGYSPSRRAEVWAFLDDIMFRAQWRAARDEDGGKPEKTGKPVAVAAHGAGEYGIVYGERKEWNLARGFSPKHADVEARRYMSKRFVRNLWIEWRNLQIKRLPMAAE
jgi:hypothetical protein